MDKAKIATVVVTFNRKSTLKACLDAIVRQTYKPTRVYIVDNASTDGTENTVEEWGYKNTVINGIAFEYLLLPNNQGGAGGFYHGIKTAHESKLYDGVWVMDDDGVPADDCLENLVPHLDYHHFIAPKVVAIDDYSVLSFGLARVETLEMRAINGIVFDEACPFNGILYSTALIDKVGYPKKEMFIWGDEVNYRIRINKVGIYPITVVKATHYHPKDRQECANTILGPIKYSSSLWKSYCMYRNIVYNMKVEKSFFRIKFFAYLCSNLYFLLFNQHSLKKIRLFLKAIYDGNHEIWGGEKQYMK